MFCKACGSELKPDAVFCGSCGADVKQVTAPLSRETNPARSNMSDSPRWFDNQVTVVVLVIFFFPAGLYALWRSSTFKSRTKWVVTGIIAVLFLVAGTRREPRAQRASADLPVSTEAEPAAPKSLKDLVSEASVDVLGEKVNWEGRPAALMSVDTIEQVDGEDKGGYLARIKYRANDQFTTRLVRVNVVSLAMKVIEKLSTDPDLSDVKIYLLMPYMEHTDKYGNDVMAQVGKFVLRKAIADRINWKNMTSDQFEQILRSDGQLMLHRTLTN